MSHAYRQSLRFPKKFSLIYYVRLPALATGHHYGQVPSTLALGFGVVGFGVIFDVFDDGTGNVLTGGGFDAFKAG